MYRKATFALALLALLVGGAGAVAATPGDAGICVVGADTACTDDSASGDVARSTETTTGSRSAGGESSRIWIPEDQNRDGRIDARFGGVQSMLSNSFFGTLFGGDAGICQVGAGGPCNGADSASESTRSTVENGSAGVCVIGVDSPCNGGDARASNSTSGSSSASDGESGQVWIPEDQNRDGEIDDEFRAESRADGSATAGQASVVGIGGALAAIFR